MTHSLCICSASSKTSAIPWPSAADIGCFCNGLLRIILQSCKLMSALYLDIRVLTPMFLAPKSGSNFVSRHSSLRCLSIPFMRCRAALCLGEKWISLLNLKCSINGIMVYFRLVQDITHSKISVCSNKLHCTILSSKLSCNTMLSSSHVWCAIIISLSMALGLVQIHSMRTFWIVVARQLASVVPTLCYPITYPWSTRQMQIMNSWFDTFKIV